MPTDKLSWILEEFEVKVDSRNILKCDALNGELTEEYKKALQQARTQILNWFLEEIVPKEKPDDATSSSYDIDNGFNACICEIKGKIEEMKK